MEVQNISGTGIIQKGFSAETSSRPITEEVENRVESESKSPDDTKGQNFDSQA